MVKSPLSLFLVLSVPVPLIFPHKIDNLTVANVVGSFCTHSSLCDSSCDSWHIPVWRNNWVFLFHHFFIQVMKIYPHVPWSPACIAEYIVDVFSLETNHPV